ncbi:MAG: DapH/DapD/GlmU-related protein [Bdellovibrionales bacterium]
MMILKYLPWNIRQKAIKFLLIKKNIPCSSRLNVDGYFPHFNVEGRIIFDAECYFRSFRLRQFITVRRGAELHIGSNVFMNDGVNICASKSIHIGHSAKIGDMVYIYDSDFHVVCPDLPVREKPVVVGDNAWIGACSIILPGAVIGSHSVIGAGSVVTGEIPPCSVAAGVPARVIKSFAAPENWRRE